MNGLMMDFPLTLPTIFRRAETSFGAKEIVARLPDKSIPPLHLRRHGAPAGARGRARGARHRARRPRRHALLEPRPAPRGLLRHPAARRRAAHAQPPPPPRRARLHRRPRRGPRAVVDASCCRCSSSSAERDARSSTSSSSRTRTRTLLAIAPTADDWQRPASSTRRGRGDVLHVRHHRQPEGRRLLAPRARAALARPSARPTSARHRASTTRCCRSSRCSTPTPGACRTPRRWSARSWSCPGRTSTPEPLVTSSQASTSTFAAGVPTVWLGVLQRPRRAARRTTSRRCARSLVRRLGRARGADRRRFEERHGAARAARRWGMTETSPLGITRRAARRAARRRRRRAVRRPREAGPRRCRSSSSASSDDDGDELPVGRQDDGRARGARPVGRRRLLRRRPSTRERFTDDGWFRTGDVATIDAARATSRSPTAPRT